MVGRGAEFGSFRFANPSAGLHESASNRSPSNKS
jgi:hypothetical protein